MRRRIFAQILAPLALSTLLVSCGGPDGGSAVDAGGVSCGTDFCAPGEMCLDDLCVAECSDVANLCGVSSEQCCTTEEACLQDSCVPLGAECEFSDDCEVDEICEPTLGRCIPRDSVEVCEYVPPPGVLAPQVACRWSPPAGDAFIEYQEVVMTPTVMNLTDDNSDGETNAQDIPDLVFTSFDRSADGCCTEKGAIRVVSGACEDDGSMRTIATLSDPQIDNSGGIALGNLHAASNTAESAPEIVATMRVGTVAYRRTSDDGSTWEEMWRNAAIPSAIHSKNGGAQPSLADVDGDGLPEVIIGNVVLNGQTGVTIWDGLVTVGATAGIGNNAFLGPVSTVADLNGDGAMEVIAGNTVYNGATGAEIWSYDFGAADLDCDPNGNGRALPCDGYNGVGNFDADDEAEVVIIRSGELFVLNHDGSLLHKVVLPVDNCSANESGPPTIADFDGDGRAEIGTAGADFYIVVDFDCVGTPLPAGCDAQNILWKVTNEDCSSRATGSSVFDFDGDGSAEVVYADETSFRVFAGKDGTVIYQDDTHRSNTRLEMPIVVDVDNDGKSEIIVPEPNHQDGTLGGIEIWEDAANNWVRTRRVWNQHAYHVTNISEDGQVPAQEDENWLNPRLNNFRQNVQPDGLFDAADLQISVTIGVCLPTAEQEIEITVTNNGALGVAAGVDVFVQLFDGTTLIDSGVIQTTIPLLPGQSEIITYSFVPTVATITVTASVDDDGAGGSQYNECIEDNNDDGGEFSPCGID